MILKNKAIHAALVATNSISQGEQASLLWKPLFKKGISINFAYRTFKWDNEARNNAAVHCVIIGFCFCNKNTEKFIITEQGEYTTVKNINAYLSSFENIFIESRAYPINDAQEIRIGNMPIDGGFYLFSESEKEDFIHKEPGAEKHFRKWIGSEEFINGKVRYCLYLGSCTPDEISRIPECKKRMNLVREYQLSSKRPATQKLAEVPHKFNVENIPSSSYIVIPEVSSERRKYIPIGFLPPEVLASNLVKIVPNATHFYFAILTSAMHMAWMRTVCGRLKSDYRYSRDLCYNTFPWPSVSAVQKQEIERLAEDVLAAREAHPELPLAEMYDPDKMPVDLRQAHHALDVAVDALYRKKPFANDEERLQLLFNLYEKLVVSHKIEKP